MLVHVRRVFDASGFTPRFKDGDDATTFLIAHYDITKCGAVLLARALTQQAQGWTAFVGERPQGWEPPKIDIRRERKTPCRQQIRIEQGEDVLVYRFASRLITEAGAQGLQEELACRMWHWERIAGPVNYLLPGATRSC